MKDVIKNNNNRARKVKQTVKGLSPEKITLNGFTYSLDITVGAEIAIEERFGMSAEEVLADAVRRKVRAPLYYVLQEIFRSQNPNFSEEEFKQLSEREVLSAFLYISQLAVEKAKEMNPDQ